MRPTDCPHCWGLGEVIREDCARNDRLFAWPCPLECLPGGLGVIRTSVTPERAAKLGRKMAANRGP